MLENIYHLSGRTSAAVIVLLQGVDLEFDSVPLPHINLKSDFALLQIFVGVIPTLPVEGISSLLGNQFDEVIMNLIVNDEPSYDENALEKAEVFPACSITTAMRMKLEMVKMIYPLFSKMLMLIYMLMTQQSINHRLLFLF